MGAFENIFGYRGRSKCPYCGTIFEYTQKPRGKRSDVMVRERPRFCSPECEAKDKADREAPAKYSNFDHYLRRNAASGFNGRVGKKRT